MATTKNTADLLAQAVSTLPDNTTQGISPQDEREMCENIAQSSYNKITDSGLVGLKLHSVNPAYESDQACISSGKVYISNKITGPGAFVPADWDIYLDLSPADKAKVDFLTVTAGADLDQMQTDIAALDGARINKGTFDQALGAFPGGGTAQDGWTWIAVGVSTTIDGIEVNPDDAIVAIVDNASTTTFAANWHLQDNTDKVISVNGNAGVVVLDKTDVGLSNVPNTDFTTAVGLNTAKLTNVSTNLSSATTSTEVTVASSDGLDVVLTSATALLAGVLTGAKFSEIVDNTLKITFPEAPNDGTQYARKSLGWEAIVSGTDIENTIFVSPNGSAVATRAAVVGNMHTTVTPERAAVIAVSGDKMHALKGEYTITTVAANGLSVDGASWFREYGANFTKSTAGVMFSNIGFSTGCNVYGFGSLYGDTLCEEIFLNDTGLDFTVEFENCINTSDSCIRDTTTTASKTAVIRGIKEIKSTANNAIRFSGSYLKVDCPIIDSTASDAIHAPNVEEVIINSNRILTTGSFYGLNQTSGNCIVSASYMARAFHSGVGNRIHNVAKMEYIISSSEICFVSGYTVWVEHAGGIMTVGLTRIIVSTGGGVLNATIKDTSGSLNFSNAVQSEANLKAEKLGADYNATAKTINITGTRARVKLIGDWRWNRNTFNLSAGELHILDRYETSTVNGEWTTFQQSGTGKIFVKGTLKDNSVSPISTMINCATTDGVIVDGAATLITSHVNQQMIKFSSAIGNVKVKGGVTNMVGFAAAKAQELEFTVIADSVLTKVTINSEIFTPTIDTKVNMAAEFITLINGSGTVGVTASPGTTTDKVNIVSNTGGTPITIAYTNNTALGANLRENSKGFNSLISTVIEDANVTE